MNKHQKFLQFNGKNIVFLNKDGQYWIALKPILDALDLPADSYIKKTKRDPFFSTCLDTMSVQVLKMSKKQGRKMICLPEKYVYGWLCILNADSVELNQYKRTCYELLYNHFHGTITNRKEILQERQLVDAEIAALTQQLKEEDEGFKTLRELKNRRKTLSTQLNSSDKELIKQPELFNHMRI